MTDPDAGRQGGDSERDGDLYSGRHERDAGDEPREPRHRVIGTPPPAEARTMLASPQPGSPGSPPEVRPRELPAEPDNPASAKKAERIVAACFLIATLAGLGFIAAYVIFPVHSVLRTQHSNFALGLTMGLTFLAFACGVVFWVRNVMPTVELTEARKPLRSTDEDRAAFKETFEEGTEASQFVKRPLIRRTLIAATIPVAVAPILLLRDLGPLPRKTLDHTVWRDGMRLLDYGSNRPIRPADFFSPGGMITVVPDGFQDDFNALAKAACIIIKFGPNQIEFTSKSSPVPGKVVQNWTVDNIIAYSKICTHVGCPAALYEQTTHHILCPCHQSTFDATRGAEVIFGPATRPLPQLPMTVDAQGFLVAKHDFTEPVGPSFWERGPST
ncbi:MAG TPA: Rieske 2Fe-2S domain-containing protein [Streptosporangiaceae bacterium]